MSTCSSCKRCILRTIDNCSFGHKTPNKPWHPTGIDDATRRNEIWVRLKCVHVLKAQCECGWGDPNGPCPVMVEAFLRVRNPNLLHKWLIWARDRPMMMTMMMTHHPLHNWDWQMATTWNILPHRANDAHAHWWCQHRPTTTCRSCAQLHCHLKADKGTKASKITTHHVIGTNVIATLLMLFLGCGFHQNYWQCRHCHYVCQHRLSSNLWWSRWCSSSFE